MLKEPKRIIAEEPCDNTASPADGKPPVRASGNRLCEFTRVMFCLSHKPHALRCHVRHQYL